MFEVIDERTPKEFEALQKLNNVKRIVTFGGWAFSVEPGTLQILREAGLSAHRKTFKNNIVSFLSDHDPDGVPLDWEYAAGVSVCYITTVHILIGRLPGSRHSR